MGTYDHWKTTNPADDYPEETWRADEGPGGPDELQLVYEALRTSNKLLVDANNIIADQNTALAKSRTALVRASQVIEAALDALVGHPDRHVRLKIADDGRVTQIGDKS